MKKIYCSLIVFSVFLTGCGAVDETDYQYSENSSSQTITSQNTESEYDSYAVFEVGGDVEDDELDNAVKIVENRLNEKITGLDYSFSVDYKSDTFRLDFNRTEECSEDFIQNLTLCNSVEFRKGSSISDPIIIDKENIVDAESYFAEDYLNWIVRIDFDEKGSSLFADLTGELAGTDTPVSIWVNDELVFAPLVSCAITDGRTVITGNFNEKSAEKLAWEINSEYLPYAVAVKECSLYQNQT